MCAQTLTPETSLSKVAVKAESKTIGRSCTKVQQSAKDDTRNQVNIESTKTGTVKVKSKTAEVPHCTKVQQSAKDSNPNQQCVFETPQSERVAVKNTNMSTYNARQSSSIPGHICSYYSFSSGNKNNWLKQNPETSTQSDHIASYSSMYVPSSKPNGLSPDKKFVEGEARKTTLPQNKISDKDELEKAKCHQVTD